MPSIAFRCRLSPFPVASPLLVSHPSVKTGAPIPVKPLSALDPATVTTWLLAATWQSADTHASSCEFDRFPVSPKPLRANHLSGWHGRALRQVDCTS